MKRNNNEKKNSKKEQWRSRPFCFPWAFFKGEEKPSFLICRSDERLTLIKLLRRIGFRRNINLLLPQVARCRDHYKNPFLERLLIKRKVKNFQLFSSHPRRVISMRTTWSLDLYGGNFKSSSLHVWHVIAQIRNALREGWAKCATGQDPVLLKGPPAFGRAKKECVKTNWIYYFQFNFPLFFYPEYVYFHKCQV